MEGHMYFSAMKQGLVNGVWAGFQPQLALFSQVSCARHALCRCVLGLSQARRGKTLHPGSCPLQSHIQSWQWWSSIPCSCTVLQSFLNVSCLVPARSQTYEWKGQARCLLGWFLPFWYSERMRIISWHPSQGPAQCKLKEPLLALVERSSPFQVVHVPLVVVRAKVYPR